MLYLICGLPGSGKTLFAIAEVKARAEKEQRPVYYSRIANLSLPWTEITDVEQWVKCPQNSIVLLDEVQHDLPSMSRGKGMKVPEWIQAFSTHRHRGVDVYLVTQDAMQFDHFVRRLVGVYWQVVRPFGMEYATVWQFEAVQQFNAKEAAAGFYDKICTKRRFDYPKELFDVYKSAEVHTHKRRLPIKRLAFIGGLVAAVATAGVVAWLTVGHLGKTAEKGKEAVAAKEGAPGSGGFGGVSLPGGDKRTIHLTTEEYVAIRKPRMGGLPESAPLFDQLTEPVTFPRLAGCVEMRGQCNCFTQQGTLIGSMERMVCKSFVMFGAFDVHRTAGEDTGSGGAVQAGNERGPTDSAPSPQGASARGGGVVVSPAVAASSGALQAPSGNGGVAGVEPASSIHRGMGVAGPPLPSPGQKRSQ